MSLDQSLLRRLREMAHGSGALLVTSDLDGTLAPIVPRPEDAAVPPATLAAMRRLVGTVKLTVVTGRDLATAQALVPVPGVEFMASHGHETSFPAIFRPPSVVLNERLAEQSRNLESLARNLESRFAGRGLLVERKARSVAFHYRADASLAVPLEEVLEVVPPGLTVLRGRFVFEVLPAGAGKGWAIDTLVERHHPRSIISLGDDITDVPMFEAVGMLADEGVSTLVIAIASDETPEEVAAAGDVVVDQTDVMGIFELLADEREGRR